MQYTGAYYTVRPFGKITALNTGTSYFHLYPLLISFNDSSKYTSDHAKHRHRKKCQNDTHARASFYVSIPIVKEEADYSASSSSARFPRITV